MRPPTLPPQPVQYMAQMVPLGAAPAPQAVHMHMAHMPGAVPGPAAAPKRSRDLKGREDQIRRTVYVGYIDPQVGGAGKRGAGLAASAACSPVTVL
jgi:hypothetical protein